VFIIGTSLVNATTSSEFIPSQDTIAPNIWDWNYYGPANKSEPFTVWANVTDNEGGSGIRNVTINIQGPNVTLHELMTFNGTYYEANIGAFPNPGTFDLYVNAYDINNNTRLGRHINIVIVDDSAPPIDPQVTLPIVVSSSAILAIVVLAFALIYDRRQDDIGENVQNSEI
jgi:hypothetical protein